MSARCVLSPGAKARVYLNLHLLGKTLKNIQELTQHDAGFLVLLLENNCKYFMPLQVKVNVFSVFRTMKNNLGMYYSPKVGLRVFRSQKEFSAC